MNLVILMIFTILTAGAQSPTDLLRNFDQKIYSLKSKGVKDLTVDIQNSELTRRIIERQSFGKISEIIFRLYWTAQPERLAIEIIGLPDGFKELREELKMNISPFIEDVLPISLEKKFSNHTFSVGSEKNSVLAKENTGVAPIPSYLLKFDNQDRLVEIVGNRPVGSLSLQLLYEKTSFSDGKWVLKEQKSLTVDPGQSYSVTKKLYYGKTQGLSTLSRVEVDTEQKPVNGRGGVKTSEAIDFKDYKINEGAALRYFLGESKSAPASPSSLGDNNL